MNAVTIYDHLAGQNAMQAIETMGNAMAKSGMFGITKVEQGTVLAFHAFFTGQSLVALAAKYHIIEGKMTMRADAMQAAFQEVGGRIIWKQTDEKVCEALFIDENLFPDGNNVRVTLEELKASGVAIGAGNKLKTNYQKFPRQMLRARAISEGVRMTRPDVIVGVYTPEEVSDFEPVRTYQPHTEPTAPLLPEKQIDYTDFIPEEDEKAALAFLRHHGWISADQELLNLAQPHLKNIANKPDAFLTEARKYLAEMNTEESA